jgi:hypothetical protein
LGEWVLGKKIAQLGPFDLTTLNLANVRIHDVQLEHGFGQIKDNCSFERDSAADICFLHSSIYQVLSP